MNNKLSIESSLNFHGLPCLYINGKYILFDPFTLKKVTFNNLNWINDEYELKKLESEGITLYEKMPQYTEPKDEKHFTFILTTDCNLGCSYCYTESKRKKLNLSPSVVLRILDSEIGENYSGNVFIQLFGGEPTLNFPAIEAITESIKNKCNNPFFYITTNGIMSEKVFNYLSDNRYGFYLSLDGTKEFNDINRVTLDGKGTFDRVYNTLNRIISNKLPVKVRSTISPSSVLNMDTFAKSMFDIGVKLIQFTPIANVGCATENDNFRLNEDFQNNYIEGLEKSLDIAKKYNSSILTPVSLALKRKPKPYCKIFHDNTKILITPEGKRTLCYGVQASYNSHSDKFLYGEFDECSRKFKLNDTVITEIMDSYEHITKNNCNSCFAQFLCNGGCFAENLTSEGDMRKLDINFCKMKQKESYFLLKRILGA